MPQDSAYDVSASFARWTRDAAEPLALRQRKPRPPFERFEFGARGDRVVGHLAPANASPSPLLLFLSESAERAAPLPGWAVATLDLPLLASRRSPKWTERLAGILQGGPDGATDRALLDEFLAQATCDLQRWLDVCERDDRLDVGRVAVAGVGPGALAAAVLRAVDARVASTALCPAGLAEALIPRAALAAGTSDCTVLEPTDEPADRARAWAAAAGCKSAASDGEAPDRALQRLAVRES